MNFINPKALKWFRDRKRLTLDQLAEKAKIDRGSINKLETGKRRSRRQRTIENLAQALGIDPDVLTDPEFAPDEPRAIQAAKTQMNFRLSNEVRNMLTLTAMRYNVQQSDILHLAPFLFRWAADLSLKHRAERLAAFEDRHAELAAMARPKHLDDHINHNLQAEDIMSVEAKSIAKRDLFAEAIPDDLLRHDYEESEQNPMVQFLASVAEELGDDVRFDYWSKGWGHPGYYLGMGEALELTGGDEVAAKHIVDGYAPLHEMPKTIAAEGPDSVAKWAAEVGERMLDDMISIDVAALQLNLD